MFRVELQSAFAEEWEYITGASLTAMASEAVCIELCERSMIMPSRFISSITVCEGRKEGRAHFPDLPVATNNCAKVSRRATENIKAPHIQRREGRGDLMLDVKRFWPVFGISLRTPCGLKASSSTGLIYLAPPSLIFAPGIKPHIHSYILIYPDLQIQPVTGEKSRSQF